MSTHCNFVAFTASWSKPGTFDVSIVRGVMGSGRSDAVYFDRIASGIEASDLAAYHIVLPKLENFAAYVDDARKIVP